ncbi:NACHT domain-containing protein [Streptomyces sp. NPDC048106]|uniref:NACHT domain-containing protein n=1 Tax=Streptomyces sp. NPDC048106 TaxID=3155750 RepID=UPI003453A243
MGVQDDRGPQHSPVTTHNDASGIFYGPVLQAGSINGGVVFTDGRGKSDIDDRTEALAGSVQTFWQHEMANRREHDPVTMPVRWHLATAKLSDQPANIRRVRAGAPAEPLDLDGRIEQVAETYQRVPSRRLVILGPAGAGKTTLAGRLALDLLEARRPGERVPVIVSVGSWNPETTGLNVWLAEQLIRDHPGLAARVHKGGPTWATALIEGGRVLPILDGFDEIASGFHHRALRKLNNTPVPMVITSRVDEYDTAVRGADVLTAAAVVELDDLTLKDLEDYLPRTAAGSLTGIWDPVLERMRTEPHEPGPAVLRRVLTNPLMLFLARTIYSDAPGHDPIRLLDTDRFPTESAVQDHLLSEFVPAVYQADRPDHPRLRSAKHAQRHLTYLAGHLQSAGTHDLAWWQLRDTIPRWQRALVFAVVDGLLTALAYGLTAGPTKRFFLGEPPYGLTTPNAPAVGLTVALASALTVALASGLTAALTRRVRRRRRRDKSPLFAGRFTPAIGAGLGTGLVWGLAIGPVIGLKYELLLFVPASGLMFMLLTGLALMSRVALTKWVRRRRRSGKAHPFSRRLTIALGTGALYGVVVGLMAGLTFGFTVRPSYGLTFGLALGVELMLLAWLAFMSRVALTRWVRRRRRRGKAHPFSRRLTIALGARLVCGLVYGLVYGLIYGLANGLKYRLVFFVPLTGLVFMLVYGLAFILRVRLTRRVRRNRLRGKSRLFSGEFIIVFGVGLGTGLAVGTVVGIAVWLVYGSTAGLATGVVLGLAAGLAAGLIGPRGAGPQPTRTRRTGRGGNRFIAGRFAVGAKVGFTAGFVVGVVVGVVATFDSGSLSDLVAMVVVGPVVGLAFGIVLALVTGFAAVLAFGLEAPADTADVARAVESRALDRGNTIRKMFMVGVPFGILNVLADALGYAPSHVPVDVLEYGLAAAVVGGFASMRATSAWIYWLVLVRGWLPLTGRLPWRVQAFLTDAHKRGALRQTGAVYQFRHARLQHHLIADSSTAASVPEAPDCHDAEPDSSSA